MIAMASNLPGGGLMGIIRHFVGLESRHDVAPSDMSNVVQMARHERARAAVETAAWDEVERETKQAHGLFWEDMLPEQHREA